MKKNIYKILGILVVLLSVHYYWENRYVELRPVIINDIVQRPIIFDNDHYKIVDKDKAPRNFYKNIRFVLDHYSANYEDYIVKEGVVYIRYKDMSDLDLMWNFTNRTGDSIWIKELINEDKLKLKLFEDSQKNK